jgi:hypothetical protein
MRRKYLITDNQKVTVEKKEYYPNIINFFWFITFEVALDKRHGKACSFRFNDED